MSRTKLPEPHWSHDTGYPPSGPNRYRLTTNAGEWRVEEFNYGLFGLGSGAWRPIRGTHTGSREQATSWLRGYQVRALQKASGWTPVDPEVGAGEG